jgi:hypothetical protein
MIFIKKIQTTKSNNFISHKIFLKKIIKLKKILHTYTQAYSAPFCILVH